MRLLDQLLKSITRQNKRNQSKLTLNAIAINNGGIELIVPAFVYRKPTKKAKPGEVMPLKNERPKIPEHGPGIWCVIPLLAKLSKHCQQTQARIIKVAGQLMEKMNFFNVYRQIEEEDESDEDSDEEQDEEDSDEEDENEAKK